MKRTPPTEQEKEPTTLEEFEAVMIRRLRERDSIAARRNILARPITEEERLQFIGADVAFALWCIQQLVRVLLHECEELPGERPER